MNKFNIGDKVKICGQMRTSEKVGFVECIDLIDEDLPHYDIIDSNKNIIASNISENILEAVEFNIFEKTMLDITVEPYMEMTTIVSQNGISIKVNQEVKKLSIPYFKVYNHIKFSNADKVARLHFKDGGIEIHESDPSGKKIWVLNSSNIKNIKNLLCKQNGSNKEYTNWQYMCFEWNRENELIGDDIDIYFSGKYDHKYDNDSRLKTAYVPSTQEMPETWKYES